MPDPTTDNIMRFLAGPRYRPQKVRALARSMGIDEREYPDFRENVKTLMAAGRIILGRGNAVMLPQRADEMVGTYRANPRGFGFVVPESPDEHGDLYIPPGRSLNAATGDVVRAKIVRAGKRGERMLHEGRVVEVLVRGNRQYVGKLQREANRWFVWPDGNTLNVPIEIGDVGAKDARPGDQVVVEVIEYPRGPSPARGVLRKRLGVRGEAVATVRGIIHQYGLDEEFPEAALDEARRVAAEHDPEREARQREDLRALTTFTIDPDDARDFDDAISLQRVGGAWELGVHIADASAFVRPGSALDEEARKRGNSVYFPGFVVPMLPEILSNGLCSLQEGQPRLVKSVFIRIDAGGRPVSTRFANAIIESKKRLTYREAQGILDGRTGGYPPPVVSALKEMEKLSRTIRKRRLADGMLVLDLPEIELVLDEKGNVTGARPADASYTHTMIEMFMVEANEAVARLLSGLGVPFLRRIHPEPDTGTSDQLAQYLRAMGQKVPKTLTRADMQRILDLTRGRSEGFAVHMAVLRSLEQAVYSPKRCGHFALASEDYCHFTSPIRRYPDITVHRLLDRYLQKRLETKRDRRDVPPHAELVALGDRCSFTERRAADAERECRKVLVLQHLEKRLGEEFDGVVTGVANIGVFVQIPDFHIDGLVRFADLPDDWWELDHARGTLLGQRTGRRIQIGDRMRVAVAAIDVASRELDLGLVRWSPRGAAAAPEAAPAPRRSKARRQVRPVRAPRKDARPGGQRGRRRGR